MRKSITSRLASVISIALLAPLAACGASPKPDPPTYPSPSPSPSPPPPSEPVHRVDPVVPTVDIAYASDEFDDPAALAAWTVMQGDLITGEQSRVDVAATTPGSLTIVAGRISWVDGHRGFFLYKLVRGDFSVTVRVRAAGRSAPTPAVDWSLTGLMLRAPATQTSTENWIGYTVGHVGTPTTESKTTQRSRSHLRLAIVDPGWIELRAVRMGSLVVLLRRQNDQGWTFESAYSRQDLPDVLQVGINAGTGVEPGDADLVSTVDWIRFRPTMVPANLLQQTLGQLVGTPRLRDGYTLPSTDASLVRRNLLPYLTT
jgi:hypothetical protein